VAVSQPALTGLDMLTNGQRACFRRSYYVPDVLQHATCRCNLPLLKSTSGFMRGSEIISFKAASYARETCSVPDGALRFVDIDVNVEIILVMVLTAIGLISRAQAGTFPCVIKYYSARIAIEARRRTAGLRVETS
jgi:hypothetical protein